MKAFVVSLNGQPFVTAGVGDDGTLTANITWVGCSPLSFAEDGMGLIVYGIDSRSGEHVRWSVPEIGAADEITITIIETDQVSPEDEWFRADMSRFRPHNDRVQRVVELNCRPGSLAQSCQSAWGIPPWATTMARSSGLEGRVPRDP